MLIASLSTASSRFLRLDGVSGVPVDLRANASLSHIVSADQQARAPDVWEMRMLVQEDQWLSLRVKWSVHDFSTRQSPDGSDQLESISFTEAGMLTSSSVGVRTRRRQAISYLPQCRAECLDLCAGEQVKDAPTNVAQLRRVRCLQSTQAQGRQRRQCASSVVSHTTLGEVSLHRHLINESRHATRRECTHRCQVADPKLLVRSFGEMDQHNVLGQ